MQLEPEQQLINLIQNASINNNEYEKTISLQLLSLAIFIVTLIGAFISIDQSKNDINTGGKVVVVVNLLLLFSSMIFGIVHLLITKNMFQKSYQNLRKALDLMRKSPAAISSPEALNTIAEEYSSTPMVFFYLQISSLTISLAVFIGLIIFILFQ